MSATPITSYDQLLAVLTRDGVMHQASPAERGVLVPTQVAGRDSALMMRWSPEQGALHVVQGLPLVVPAERRAAVSRAMVLLNHALALPTLTLDVDRGAVFYRSLLPILRATPPLVEDLRRLFSLVVRNATDLTRVLESIALGGAEPEVAVQGWLDAQRPRASEA